MRLFNRVPFKGLGFRANLEDHVTSQLRGFLERFLKGFYKGSVGA